MDERAFEKRLTQGWQALSPPADLKARVRAQLPPATGGGASSVTLVRRGPSRWSALRASGSLGVGVGGLLIGLGFVAGYLLRSDLDGDVRRARTDREELAPALAVTASAPLLPGPAADRTPASAPVRSTAPAPEATAASASPAVPARGSAGALPERPRATPERSRAHGSAAVAAKPEPAGAGPSAAEELALLGRAERAVRSRNAVLALSLSATLDERYPRSMLREERQAIALMARCQAGAADGPGERERFTRQYPRSVYAERIDGECGPELAQRGSDANSPAAPTKASGVDMNAIEGGKHAQPQSP
jgi:hypothetical protein